MKCPECGYVSFSDLRECKKCGHPFGKASVPAEPKSTSGRAGWADELSERVAGFRRRNREARGALSSADSPRLSFDGELRPSGGANSETAETTRGSESLLDRAFADESAVGNGSSLEFPALSPRMAPGKRPSSAPPVSAARTDFAGASRTQPMIVEFSAASSRSASADVDEVPIAPLGRRFVAGVLDTLILLAAGGVFAGLFAAAHGKIEAQPLDLAVAAVIALFWIFFYFSLFTAFALSSPGQAAMSLTVRNLDGGLPTRQEALLRAFGYLISIIAVMIGFLWAAMDSDGMAWHDHISGTLLVVAGSPGMASS